ncbi:MAG: hypothetical protein RLY16_2759 [Bacteroidota bacterium]|jgi:hypothetical protein
MRANIPGHNYTLANAENKHIEGQALQFVHHEPVNYETGEYRLFADGTTEQEVLICLIDRLIFLNKNRQAQNLDSIIFKLQDCLLQLEGKAIENASMKQGNMRVA